MKTQRISAALVAAIVAVSLAGSGSAWAERKQDQQGHSQHKADRYDKRANKRNTAVLREHHSNKRHDRVARHDRRTHKRHDRVARHDRRTHKRDDRVARHDRRTHKRDDRIAKQDRRQHKRNHYAVKQDHRSHRGKHDVRRDRRYTAHAAGGHYKKHGYGNAHRPYYARHKAYKKHYDKHSYRRYGHGGYNRHNYYYDDDDDSDEKLLIGLLVGGLVGYAINSAQDDDNSYDSYPPAGSGSTSQAMVYPADTRYGGTCLQKREYQTKVIIGGRSVDAYGTACLQPDGSWTRGPAQVAQY